MDWARAATFTVSTHTHTLFQPYISPESKRDTMRMSALYSFSILELKTDGPSLPPCIILTFFPRAIMTYEWMVGEIFALNSTRDQALLAHPNTLTYKTRECLNVLMLNPYS